MAELASARSNGTVDTVTPDLYSPSFVRHLFDEMAGTYGVVNLISSFGFCVRWRRQCLDLIEIPRGATVIDLMAGMGELGPALSRRLGPGGRITAVVLSAQMCRRARGRASSGRLATSLRVIEADALDLPLADGCADAVVCSFGLKTFSPEQLDVLAGQVARTLRPGGRFAFLEISVPQAAVLRVPYMFYLNHVIPLLGRALMGNPENYRMLGVYTSRFGNCDRVAEAFAAAGLTTYRRRFFFGCATGVCGGRSGVCASLTS